MTVEWDKVAQGPGLAGSRWHFFLLQYSQNNVFVDLLSSGNAILRKTSYLVLS